MKTFNEVDFEKYYLDAEPITKVLPASAWKDSIDDLLLNGISLVGATMPWGKTHDLIRFRGSEVTLWQGISGHGKSQVLGMVALGFLAQGESVCIASFEMKPQLTYFRMLRQAAQCNNPSPEFSDKVLDWMEDKFWIYDHLGAVNAESVYAAIRYCANELKVKHFVIDNLMKCVKNEDDYSGQKAFVDKVCALAREHDMHIHIVHHVRKGQTEDQIPGKFDARGSGTIVDQVDQVLTVWRNKKKEVELRRSPDDQAIKDKPDAIIACDKNRHGDWEGKIALWHHRASLQYTANSQCRPFDVIKGVAG